MYCTSLFTHIYFNRLKDKFSSGKKFTVTKAVNDELKAVATGRLD